jgi:glycosyltransferase involved in cell wall biosynthesis
MISIIIPTYNNENTIKNCLDSIINQRCKDVQIIVINDGSTDNTQDICSQYPIELYNVKHGGVGHARNIGLKYIKGDCVSFVDSDDTLPEGTLGLLDRSDYDLIVGDFNLFKDKIYTPKQSIHQKLQYGNQEDFRQEVIKYLHYPRGNNNLCGPLWSKSYQTNIIQNNHIRFNENVDRWEDTQFNLDYFQYVRHYLYLPYNVYNYNKDNRLYGTSILNYMSLFNKVEEYLEDTHAEYKEKIQLDFIKYFLKRHLYEEGKLVLL